MKLNKVCEGWFKQCILVIGNLNKGVVKYGILAQGRLGSQERVSSIIFGNSTS